jgi:hypothetical protein
MRLIQETEPTLQCLQILPRIVTEMIDYCGQSFFPIPDSTLAPLIEVCWKCRNEPRDSWESSFRKVYWLILNHRYLKFTFCLNFIKAGEDQRFYLKTMAIILVLRGL